MGVDPADSRTSAQKQQADATTRRTAAMADQMEKERLAQEKRDLAALKGSGKAAKKPTSSATHGSMAATDNTVPKPKKKKKKPEPEFFTARASKEAASKPAGK